METQNITLALPKALLQKAKIVAAKRETSVSALVAASLAEVVREEDAYEQAMRRSVARARAGYPLGYRGSSPGWRDELHER